MRWIENVLRLTACTLAALSLASATATVAHAEQDGEEDTPEEIAVPSADPSDEPDAPFDQPIDLATPLILPSGHTIDPSRFTRGLSTSPWSSRVGVDNRDATPRADLQLERWIVGAVPQQTVGVAWATVTAPGLVAWDKTAIESRVDPYQQGRVGVTLSRSVPVGDDVSVTLQNGLAWIQPLLQGVPTVAHGADGTLEGNHSVRFTFLPMSTTLAIGATTSTTDDRWLRSLSAEQRLFGGPVSVSGAVSETATGDLSTSVRAGFRRNW